MEQKPCATGVSDMCAVAISWNAKAFKGKPFQLHCTGKMFPASRIESEFLNKFYAMNVVLKRAPKAVVTDSNMDLDDNFLHPVILYKEEDLGAENDYSYRAAILFLPQCGKFYCHRERCKGDVGVPGTFTAHDMSWLRLQRTVTKRADDQFDVSFVFDKHSFVRRFFFETQGEPELRNEVRHADGWHFLDENHLISAWRISTGRKHPSSRTELSRRQSSAKIPMVQSCRRIYCRVRTLVLSLWTILLRNTNVFLRRRTARRKTAVTSSVGVGTTGSKNLVG